MIEGIGIVICVYVNPESDQFWAVLMDSWYATKEIMLTIEKYENIYYCPLKENRQVDDSNASQHYRRVDALVWTEAEKQNGKTIKIKGFPGNHKVKLFRVVLSAKRTDYTRHGHKLRFFMSRKAQFVTAGIICRDQ